MKTCAKIQLAAAILIFAVIIAGAVMSCYVKGDAQLDFKAMYAASVAHQMGLNPYDKEEASRVVPDTPAFPYVYAPYTLYIFQPLTFFKLRTATSIFLTIKLVTVCTLLFLWNRIFDFSRHPLLFLLMVAFAFNSSLLDDLRAGNTSVFEQFFIWLGFYFYTRDKIVCFTAAIILAATFKFTPILLLGLLVTRLRRREFMCLGFAGIFFLALLAFNAMAWPQLFSAFLHNISGLESDRSEYNPATWALISNENDYFRLKTGWSLPLLVPIMIYLTVCLGVASIAGLAFKRLLSLNEKQANLWRICLICFVYALLIPRFKNYSYILLIAPTLYILISRPLAGPLLPFCGLLMIFTNRHSLLLESALQPLYRFQDEYYSLILAWIIGAMFCYSILRKPQADPDTPGDEDQASIEKPAASPGPA